MKSPRLWQILLAVGALVAAGLIADLFDAPTKSLRVGHYLALWPAMGLVVFSLGRLLRRKMAPGRFQRSFGLLVGFASVLVPLVLIGPIERSVITFGIGKITHELTGLTDFLEVQQTFEPQALVTALGAPEHVYGVAISRSAQGYVISTAMTAIDIDGYTVYRHAGTPQWLYFHNDQPDDVPARATYADALADVREHTATLTTAACTTSTRQACQDHEQCAQNEHWQCRLNADTDQ